MSASKTPQLKFLILLILLAGAGFYAAKHSPHLGLDLKGGTRLTLEAQANAQVPQITPSVMDSLQMVIEQRVNKFGVSEAIVQKSGANRLLVEIPGIKDPEEAKNQLGKVGLLEFKREHNGGWSPSGVSGRDLKSARLDQNSDQNSRGWVVAFELTNAGAEKFAKVTTELHQTKQKLGIFFDGVLISDPYIDNPILSGSGMIKGDFEEEEAKSIVDTLNAGALPVNVNVIEESTVGALLGENSLKQSLNAGIAGLLAVLVFMIGYYRKLGLVANVGLVAYTLLSYAVLMLVGVTFTLAGIAGFILSIGMAVDANILIFERSKEELAQGKAFKKAIALGFDRALPSILDSNFTTLITCAVLWGLGTGSVKGFAVTLALGVAVSMFTALTVTRTILELALGADTRPRMTFSKG
ncbi:MAG: protein translocase subunit SecD [Vampirovibrio sp.]